MGHHQTRPDRVRGFLPLRRCRTQGVGEMNGSPRENVPVIFEVMLQERHLADEFTREHERPNQHVGIHQVPDHITEKFLSKRRVCTQSDLQHSKRERIEKHGFGKQITR
eukprot:Polyplicarium_translucidae@DN2635_c0_g1_i3.p2